MNLKRNFGCGIRKTYVLEGLRAWDFELPLRECPGRFLRIMDRDPCVYKSNRLCVVSFLVFSILNWGILCRFPKTMGDYPEYLNFYQVFLNTIGSSGTGGRFSALIALRASQCDETFNPKYFSKPQNSLERTLKEARTSTHIQICENPMSICLKPPKSWTAIWHPIIGFKIAPRATYYAPNICPS